MKNKTKQSSKSKGTFTKDNKISKNGLCPGDGMFRRAIKRLIFMPDGQFSMTRIIMVLTVIFSFSVGLTGLLAYLFSGNVNPTTGKIINRIVLPDNLYTFATTLAGGGFVQYGLTKAKNAWDSKIDVKKEEVKIKHNSTKKEPAVM